MDRDYIIRILIEARDNVSRAWRSMADEVESGMRRMSSGSRGLHRDIGAVDHDFEHFGRSARAAGVELDRMGRLAQRTAGNLDLLGATLQGIGLLEVIRHAQQLIAVVVALGGQLVALAGSATMAAGAIGGGLVAAIGQAIPAVGLLVAAFNRLKAIMEVIKLQQAEQKAAATQTSTAVQKLAKDTEGLANAEYNLMLAHRNLADAQRALRYEQEMLGDARAEAIRQLEDLIDAEKRAKLEAQGADLGVEQARANLRRQIASGGGGGLDLAQAQLGVQQALLGQTEAHTAAVRATQDLHKQVFDPTTAKQVTGLQAMPAMLQHTQQMFEANRRLKDSEHGVKQAEQALADARKRLTADTDKQTAAQTNLNYAMSQLDPVEKATLERLKHLMDVYKRVMRPVTDIIVAEFGRVFDDLAAMLGDPKLQQAMQTLAGGLAKAIDIISKGFTGKGSREFFEFMMTEGARNAPILADAFTKFAEAMANIAKAASPMLHTFFVSLDKMLGNLAKWTAQNPKKLQDFFESAADNAAAWGKLLWAVLRFWGALTGASAKSGKTLVDSITEQLNKWTDYLHNNRKAVGDFFDRANQIGGEFWRVIKRVGEALMNMFQEDNVKPLADFLVNVLIPAIQDAFIIFGKISGAMEGMFSLPGFQKFSKFVFEVLILTVAFGKMSKLIGDLTQALKLMWATQPEIIIFAVIAVAVYELEKRFHMLRKAWDEHSQGIKDALNRLNDAFKQVFGPGGINTVLKWTADYIGVVADVFLTQLEAFIRFAADFLKLFGDLIHGRWSKIWDDVKQLFEDWAVGWWKTIKAWFNGVVKLFHLEDVVDAVTGAANKIVGVIKDIFSPVVDFFKGIIKGWEAVFKTFGDVIHGRWSNIWGDVKDIVTTTFTNMYNFLRTIINDIIHAVNWLITKIGIDKIPDLPKIGGSHDASTPPAAPQANFAEGGIVRPVPGGLIRVVEAGHPEAIIPLDPSKRARANEVLKETLHIMGKSAWQGDQEPTGFASGGIAIEKKITAAAFSQLGVPYHFGWEVPGKGLDCSSLVQYAYGQAGVHIPRLTYDQWPASRHPAMKNIQPVDLVFSEWGSQGPGHVRMYIGGGKVIAAPHTGDHVRVQDLNDRGDQKLGRFLTDDKKGDTGSFFGFVKGVYGTAKSPVGDAVSGLKSIFGAITDPIGWVKDHLPKPGKGLLGDVVEGVENMVLRGLGGMVSGLFDFFVGGGGAGRTSGEGRSQVINTIMVAAPQDQLDPVAVLAYAMEEGGLGWGARGDRRGGVPTSFGPFQAHMGGAVPRAMNRATAEKWANSPIGLVQMMAMMAHGSGGIPGAAGLHGERALRQIYASFGRGTAKAIPRGIALLDDAAKIAEEWTKTHPIHSPVHLAKGGIVTSPTLALIGEAGPEAVIPFADGGIAAGGNLGGPFAGFGAAMAAQAYQQYGPRAAPSVERYLDETLKQLEATIKRFGERAFGSFARAAEAAANMMEALDEKIESVKTQTQTRLEALRRNLQVSMLGIGNFGKTLSGLVSGRITIAQLATFRRGMTDVQKIQLQIKELAKEFEELMSEKGVIQTAIEAVKIAMKKAKGAALEQLKAELIKLNADLTEINQAIVDNISSAMDAQDALLQAQADALEKAKQAALDALQKMLDDIDKFFGQIQSQLDIGTQIFALLHPFDYVGQAQMLARKLHVLRAYLDKLVGEGGPGMDTVLAGLHVTGGLTSIFNLPGNYISGMQAGGVLPQRVPATKGGQLFVVGEGDYSEYVIPTDPRMRSRAMQLIKAMLMEMGHGLMYGVQDSGPSPGPIYGPPEAQMGGPYLPGGYPAPAPPPGPTGNENDPVHTTTESSGQDPVHVELSQDQRDDIANKIATTVHDILQTLIDIFNTYLQGIQAATQRTFTLDDILIKIAELNNDQKGQLSLMNDEMRALILEQQRLQHLQGAANELTEQQQYDLKVAIAQNQLAQLELKKAIEDLTGSLKPQSFSSIAWQWFRQAVFTGMGGLLPQYQIPHFQHGGIVPRDGLIYAHGGEVVIPVHSTPGMMNLPDAATQRALRRQGWVMPQEWRDWLNEMFMKYRQDIVNLYITNPTEVLDVEHLMRTLAFEYEQRKANA